MKKSTLYNLFLVIFFATSSLLFVSCEKEIEVDLPKYESKLVIEGSIDQGMPALVTITRSTDYFARYDSATLARMFVSNAQVYISDNFGNVDTLVFGVDPNQPLPFVYKGNSLFGQVGGVYSLKVVLEDKVYHATTTILPTVPLDSIFFVVQNQQDGSGIIRVKFTDPAGVPNYYSVFTKVLGKDPIFNPVWGGATFDDKLIDGISSNGDLYRGSSSNLIQDTAQGEDQLLSRYYQPGDTVVVKWCSIDYTSYRFWYSAEMEINSGGNPFMTPAPIISNIPNALGVWCGYGTHLDTIVIPSSAKR